MENSWKQQLDVTSVARDVLREWRTILLLAISISLFTNIVVTMRYDPVFTTKTTFTVTTKGMNGNVYQDLNSATMMAGRFQEVLDSQLLKKRIMKDLGMKQLDATMTANQVEETNMIELSVSAHSATDAYRILNSVLENYKQVSDYVVGDVILETIQRPTIPTGASNAPNLTKMMAVSLVVTALLSALLIGYLSYRRDTVKNEQQMHEKVDAKLLGTIYHENKKKGKKKRKGRRTSEISMLIENPLRSFPFVESNRLTAARVRSHMDRSGRKVVLITSVLENEGKSTVSANMALALAASGSNVLLLDCDFRKPSQHKIFEVLPEVCMDYAESLKNGAGMNSLIKKYGNMSLYIGFNKAENQEENNEQIKALQQMIAHFRTSMDYIILDTAPIALVSQVEELARLADTAILVVREDMVLAQDVNDAVDALGRAADHMLGCILSDAAKNPNRKLKYSGYGGHHGKRAK